MSFTPAAMGNVSSVSSTLYTAEDGYPRVDNITLEDFMIEQKGPKSFYSTINAISFIFTLLLMTSTCFPNLNKSCNEITFDTPLVTAIYGFNYSVNPSGCLLINNKRPICTNVRECFTSACDMFMKYDNALSFGFSSLALSPLTVNKSDLCSINPFLINYPIDGYQIIILCCITLISTVLCIVDHIGYYNMMPCPLRKRITITLIIIHWWAKIWLFGIGSLVLYTWKTKLEIVVYIGFIVISSIELISYIILIIRYHKL